ncbi:MAG: radical SAM protein [Candidatus Omnitrophica bacterium]|nr:radical SAM protein [Candidatus Omnitrophota bacterium]
MNTPALLMADPEGNICAHPRLRMAVGSARHRRLPRPEELIALPKGSTLFSLPGRAPVGFDPQTQRQITVEEYQGIPVTAVAAFLIPAFLRLALPAYAVRQPQALPLWAYTAAGFRKGKFYVCAVRVDARIRQSPRFYDSRRIQHKVNSFYQKSPRNRLYAHLANCALNYNCLAAKNLFLERWEAPLPTAQSCNARCVGCLSYQDSDCAASHNRIRFRPTVEELCEVMTHHLNTAREAIVSFGQGCEGEPLTETPLIAESIARVRARTSRGTIHMNTNASMPDKIETLCKAGIDSFRVSLNSVRKELYHAYFRPRGYTFRDVLESIAIAKRRRKFVSLNLLIFPEVTDDAREAAALLKFLTRTKIDMIQWRNLNIDPEQYLPCVRPWLTHPQGLIALHARTRNRFQGLKSGYFNLPTRSFSTSL